ncbi:YceI family protein [Daejeonella sp.]|uniref:YceI family protein n=1 Tax=Daejeonella sp. TaxID=2805397 RepID=UPI003982F834
MSNLNLSTRKYFSRFLLLITVLSIHAFTQKATGQSSYKSTVGSQIKVNGTSNIHDWIMSATNFNCEGSFLLKNDQLQDVTALNFSLPVTNLKGKEDLLNKRAHKALKAEQFSRITFQLTNATVVAQQKSIKVTGNLTIAGVTKRVSIQTNYTVNGEELTCKGSQNIDMSDFNIKAPTFMMGALKVANEVTIDILLKLKN